MSKRNWDDFDPNASDPDDEDYTTSTHQRSKGSRIQKLVKSKPQRKRQRTGFDDDDSEAISDSMLEEDSFGDIESGSEEPSEDEINEATGRPLRRSAQKQVNYDEDSHESSIDDTIDGNGSKSPRKGKKRSSNSSKPRLIVKLALPNHSSRTDSHRATHIRKHSTSPKKAGNPIPFKNMTRRSSRLAHDESEALVALTISGNHENVVRPGTRSPEASSPRPVRASKSAKKPPSAIFETENENSLGSTNSSHERSKETGEDNEAVATDEDEGLPRTQEPPSEVEVSATQMNIDDHENPVEVVVPESNVEDNIEDDDDEEDDIVSRHRRTARKHNDLGDVDGRKMSNEILSDRQDRHALSTRQGARKKGIDDTSDFEPDQGKPSDEELSASSEDGKSPPKSSVVRDDSTHRVKRPRRRQQSARPASSASEANDSEVAEEIAVELQELQEGRPRRKKRRDSFDIRPRTRTRKPVDYRILRPETNVLLEDDTAPITASTPSKRRGGGNGGWQRSLFSTYGPFGGAGGPAPVFGGPPGATGGVDSDSSDDDGLGRPRGIPALPAISAATPTAAAPPGFGIFPPAQTHSSDPIHSTLGKVKDKQALADADPLGVDQNVTFDGVGGMQSHIDQLKEMVMLPLLYPEIFQKFRITPPRGVLFHGPPGTGKTLLARALASTVSSQGRKVTFYMRKGADALSKWVGEAERQLRLLFEEARKNQPSIIFFDEIDGLAPVRSSKQEQIHASIVSTLLALMDGMDGRGQVIVIGATNRPDSVDPALRRPGRFDREFYFPLPDQTARRAIIDIHTKGWDPALPSELKDQLAAATKGYGGADLRSLCTEAALNSVQRTYPQIYRSYEKRLIKPENIHVTSRDFMLSLEKIVPSSERSASSGSAPLPKSVAPLLEGALSDIKHLLDEALPQKKQRTALEEAEYEDSVLDTGLRRELLHQEFSKARIFRPRLLIHGPKGMGQHYLASAVLNHFESLHVQSFDLSTLLGDSTRSPEATIIQLFSEVKRHKPSVVFIPDVESWFGTIGDSAITTFTGLLQSLLPTDPVLVLGFSDGINGHEQSNGSLQLTRRLFGYTSRNRYTIAKPNRDARKLFFAPLIEHLSSAPTDFPDPEKRQRRILEELPLAPSKPSDGSKEPTKEELKTQQRRDRRTLNHLKLRIQPIMDQIKMKYKKFRTPVIEDSQIRYLYEEDDSANLVTTDLPLQARQQTQFRPFERGQDAKGEPGLIEIATNRFYYNMETVTIEKRLSNGYYKRPRDFLADIKKLTKDAKTADDPERHLKASELQTNVEVDLDQFEIDCPSLVAECEALYQRELKRQRQKTDSSNITSSQPMAPPEARVRIQQEEDSDMAEPQSFSGVANGREISDGAKADTSFYQPTHNSFVSNMTGDLDRLPGQQVSNSTSNTSNGFKTTTSGDSQSTGHVQNGSFGQSAQTRSIYHSTGAPITVEQRLQTGQLSQRGAITPIAEGAHPSMYHNSASTTSSDKRNTNSSTDRATQSTQARQDTQETNNRLDVSNFLGQPISGSQLPDTQSSPRETSSFPSTDRPRAGTGDQSQSLPSQPSQPPPVRRNSESDPMQIAKIVNGDGSQDNNLQVDALQVRNFADLLVTETSSCSVEQLEQINSALMDFVWKSRGFWDRTVVFQGARSLFTETLEDMRGLQSFGKSSMGNGF